MYKDKYTLPIPIDLESKSSQIKAMTIYWDTSRASHTSILDIHIHIESLMGRIWGSSNHIHAEDNGSRDAGLENRDNRDRHPETRGANFRGKSVAKRTME